MNFVSITVSAAKSFFKSLIHGTVSYHCFKSQPGVAYKSVTYKLKDETMKDVSTNISMKNVIKECLQNIKK